MSDSFGVSDGLSLVVNRKKVTKTINGKQVTSYPKELEDTLVLRDAITVVHRKKKIG